MTARVLGVELRRSAAVWAALISLPHWLISNTEVGRGLSQVAQSQRLMLALFIPLALGVGAWQARRERRSRMEELIATTARPPWQRLLPTAGALAIGAVGGCFVIFAALTAHAAAVDAYLSASALPFIAVGALYLVVAVWLGLAIGRLLPSVLTPAFLVVAGMVLLLGVVVFGEGREVGSTADPAPGAQLLLPARGGGFGNFDALTARVHLAQAVWVVALAAAALILYVASRYARLAAIVPVVLGAAVVLPLLPRHAHEAVVLDRGAIALVCTPDAPQVCVRRVHHLALAGLREPGREALAILSAKLPQAPGSVVEAYYEPGYPSATGPPPRADVLYAQVWTDKMGRASSPVRDNMWTLLMGAGTRPCDNAPSWLTPERARYDTARLVAAAWLLDEEPLPPTYRTDHWGWLPDQTVSLPAYQALRALPADEQRTRVAALREAELACDGRDRLDILVGPGDPR